MLVAGGARHWQGAASNGGRISLRRGAWRRARTCQCWQARVGVPGLLPGDPGPGLFFPAATGSTAAGRPSGQSGLRGLPGQDSCLAYALATWQEYGVWGGTTERERRAMSRARKRRASSRARQGQLTSRPSNGH